MTERSVVVSEVFGPTLQGEGPHCGQRAGFIRFGGCNLACSWCDTAYTWDGQRYDLRHELTRYPVEHVAAAVTRMEVDLVIITGGEPLLHQQHGLEHLLSWLAVTGMRIDVETNGTIRARAETAGYVDLFVVSPKLAHAGMPTTHTLKPDVLAEWAKLARAGKAAFKFVARDETDVLHVQRITEDMDIPDRCVWIMPEGAVPAVVAEHGAQLVDYALAAGFNFTTRLHVLLWGSERGR